MEIFLQSEAWIALLTLILLEVVLGIDNIIFISIVANKLPEHRQKKARLTGLSLALILRIIMLIGITWITRFSRPLITILETEVSGRDLILAAGGLFLLAKSTTEIHHKIEGEKERPGLSKQATFSGIIFQILLLDFIFSLDSILTAIGMTREILIMVVAVIVSIIIMMIFAGKISKFINKNPTLQILALSFLILIGFMLVIESLGYHVPKGYIYFSVFFSLMVEMLNMRMRKKKKTAKAS